MSVTGIGPSTFPPTQHSWDWQANGSDGQNANGAASTGAASDGAPTNGSAQTSGSDVQPTRGSVDRTRSSDSTNVTDGENGQRAPLPPPQAATAPGTGQKVDIIA